MAVAIMFRRALVLCALALAVCPAAASASELPSAPGTKSAWTARVLTPVDALAKPGRGAALQRLGRNTPFWGGPNVLLVLGARTVDGVDYVKVLLKRMPAGSGVWIPADTVRLARERRRVVVDLSARSLTVWDDGHAILRDRVVIGARSTPTPTGQFAIDAPVDQPRSSLLGRRVLALAAYSRALARYQGGLPQVAFHAYEKLGAPLGAAASHGCIRMRQATLSRLLRLLERGTPVLIRH
jgi:lipoprotein-anchoring transpeptidase ErfK/SrfK